MDQIRALVAEAVGKEMESFRKEISGLKEETEKLKKENSELRSTVKNLEMYVDEIEQYSRKSSLILSGEGVPEHKKDETTEETREIALKIMKEKLKVDVKGGVVACHRLRNKSRMIVKFQDMEDRNKVYQAKFNQSEGAGIIIHENLTDKRAKQVKVLADMKHDKDHVVNYHTKNGVILARDSRDKRYARIQPWFSRDEIVKAMAEAAALPRRAEADQGRFLQSQTLVRIPAGHVINKAVSMESLMAEAGRRSGPSTRQSSSKNK